MIITFKKIQCNSGGKYPVIRYIDYTGKWFKQEFNGHFKFSKQLPIIKDYGDIELDVIDEGVFGLRVIN